MFRPPTRLVTAAAATVVLTAGSMTAMATGSVDQTTASAPAANTPLNVGYFTQWGIYGRGFTVKDLDTSGAAEHLTHINYAFANVNEDGLCFEDNIPGEGDAWADYQWPVPAELSVDGVGDAWGTAERQLRPAAQVKGEVSPPEGQYRDRRLVVVDLLLQRRADA